MDENIESESISTDQDENLAKDREAFKEELKSEGYRTLLDLISYPIDKIFEKIPCKSKPIPFNISIFILGSIILFLSLGISALVDEFQGFRILILEFFNVVISYFLIVLVKSYIDQLREGFRSDLIDYVNSKASLNEIKSWFVRTEKSKRPLIYGVIFSIGFSIFLTFLGPSLILQINRNFLGWGPLFLLLFANFPIGAGGYYLWKTRNFRIQAKSWDFKIYEPNPSKSIVILRLSKLLATPVTIIAFLAALTTFAFSITRSFSLITLLIAVICGWYPMLSLFVRNHIALASIITRAKQKKLSELQEKITKYEPESLKSTDSIEYLQKLMDYHDRIASTPNSALNFRITFGFFNTLLLPLITLFLTNLDTLIKLLP